MLVEQLVAGVERHPHHDMRGVELTRDEASRRSRSILGSLARDDLGYPDPAERRHTLRPRNEPTAVAGCGRIGRVTSAERLDWPQYYAAQAGRPVRDLVIRGAGAVERPGHAVDLGCGDGTETAWLLEHGWWVTAVDGTPEALGLVTQKAEGHRERVEVVLADLADYDVPPAELVVACASLPFVPPSRFDQVWQRVRNAIRGGGVLAVNLFGERDTWAQPDTLVPGLTFHTRDQVEQLVRGLTVVEISEHEYDGPSGGGPKHWHRFDVIARAGD